MADQAETLRRLMEERAPAAAHDGRIVAISAGAGGDGASTLVACLGASFAHWGCLARVVDATGAPEGAPLAWHAPPAHSILVVSPRAVSLAGAESLARRLARRFGRFRADVVVNRVTDGREGWSTFRKLKESEGRMPGVQLEYLGHLEASEKIGRAMMKSEFLLDLRAGVLSNPSLELLSKRLRRERLGGEATIESPSTRSGRLKEEPAARSPRKGAATFWRSLLGGEA
jgi:Mrp family chromosome partitioning ATPase